MNYVELPLFCGFLSSVCFVERVHKKKEKVFGQAKVIGHRTVHSRLHLQLHQVKS